MPTLTIRNIQKAQQWNLRAIANLKPSGMYGRKIRDITAALHRYEVTVTHVDTGALRASHRVEVNGLMGRIYIDESARNPRSHAKTSRYGEIEDARGGSHAFGRRTAEDGAPRIVGQALALLARSLQ